MHPRTHEADLVAGNFHAGLQGAIVVIAPRTILAVRNNLHHSFSALGREAWAGGLHVEHQSAHRGSQFLITKRHVGFSELGLQVRLLNIQLLNRLLQLLNALVENRRLTQAINLVLHQTTTRFLNRIFL